MVDVHLLNKNNIINLTVPGKTLIRGRTSPNLYFHTPIEILLSALGLCIGGIIVNYCRLNDLDVKIFESINMDYLNGQSYVVLKYDRTLKKEHINRLSDEIMNCPISRELNNKIISEWYESSLSTDELTKIQSTQSPCCGAK